MSSSAASHRLGLGFRKRILRAIRDIDVIALAPRNQQGERVGGVLGSRRR